MRRFGFSVIEVDQKHGFDLGVLENQKLVKGLISSGLITTVHLGTPCSSFSRARERGGGPGALRSDDHPLGRPGFKSIDQLQVTNGNRLARFSFTIQQLCYSLGVAACMENPAASRIWQMPQALRLCQRP